MLDELELIIDSVEYEEVSVDNAILQIRLDHMNDFPWILTPLLPSLKLVLES